MAVCVFFNKKCTSQHSLKRVIDYVLDETKTNDKLCFGFGVNTKNAYEEMIAVKEAFHKTDKRQYVHFAISFDDNITPEKTFEIGMQLAQYYAKDYQVIMANHTDKPYLHCHFVINTVNMNTGLKFKQNKTELAKFKEFANEIFKKYNVKPIERGDNPKQTNGEVRTRQRGKIPLKDTFRDDIKSSLKETTSKSAFIQKMNAKGYIVNWTNERKYITFINQDGKKYRDKTLGYSKESIENIMGNNEKVIGRRTGISNFLQKLLPDKGNFIYFPTGVIPPEVDHLSKDEMLRVLGEFWNNIKSQQEKAIRQNEDESDRLKELQAFDNIMEWVYDAYYEVERQINREKSETHDDDWDMEV